MKKFTAILLCIVLVFIAIPFVANAWIPPGASGVKVTPTNVTGAGVADAGVQNGAGLFDGTQVNEWNTNQVLYWNNISTDFVEFTISTSVNIWRAGTSSFSSDNNPLSIFRKNVDNTYTDVTTTYSLSTSAINENQWEKFVEDLPAGTYKFTQQSSATRIDSEWYLESTTTLIPAPGPIPAGLLEGIQTTNGVEEFTDNDVTTSELVVSGQVFTFPNTETISSIRVKADGGNFGIHFWDINGEYITGPDYEYGYLGELNGDSYAITPVQGVKSIALYYISDPSVRLYEFEVYSTTSDTTAPATPTNLTAIAGDSQVSLSWDANNDVDLAGYNVYRDGVKINTTLVIGETFVDTGLTNGVEYAYTVTAVDTSGNESEESNVALATPFAALESGRALIEITLENGLEKEYDWSMDEVNDFLDWYDARDTGTGPARYEVVKTYNTGPFLSRKDYLVFDKIITFEIMEYEE